MCSQALLLATIGRSGATLMSSDLKKATPLFMLLLM